MPRTHPGPPVANPFAASEPVEHADVRAVDVGGTQEPPGGLAFLDGVQRYAVEGRFGLAPVVRGYVAAAAMRRQPGGTLRAVVERTDEFVVAPLARLEAAQRDALERTELPLFDCGDGERPHPILDVQQAAVFVERRREDIERTVARRYVDDAPEGWLVVDGSITALGDLVTRVSGLLGVIKSHDTQFLDGRDMEAALTLAVGQRTSVFARTAGKRERVYTWYLRLWPWEGEDLLHGLVRVERAPRRETVSEATTVSRWVLAERTPLAARDGRWDRLLYPIHQVETYLRSKVGTW